MGSTKYFVRFHDGSYMEFDNLFEYLAFTNSDTRSCLKIFLLGSVIFILSAILLYLFCAALK